MIQWGDDWPGVFIRGDNAMNYAYALRCVLETQRNPDPVMRGVVGSLAALLESCDLYSERRQ